MRSAGKFGRRKSDWYLPIGWALIIGLAMGWALDNRAKSEEIARLSSTLQRAMELSETRPPLETSAVPESNRPAEVTPSDSSPQEPGTVQTSGTAHPSGTPQAQLAPTPLP